MVHQSGSLVIFVIVLSWLGCSKGLQHRVGDSTWSIPPTQDFYTNWSAYQYFQIGDTLVFEFQSEFHNVMQVSRREYESCTAENPFQAFLIGPATVPLIQQGIYYFICSFGNFCVVGQKLSITVHHHHYLHSPTKSPPLLPIFTQSPGPVIPSVPYEEDILTKPPAHVSYAALSAPSPVSLISTWSLGVCFTVCRGFGGKVVLVVVIFHVLAFE